MTIKFYSAIVFVKIFSYVCINGTRIASHKNSVRVFLYARN